MLFILLWFFPFQIRKHIIVYGTELYKLSVFFTRLVNDTNRRGERNIKRDGEELNSGPWRGRHEPYHGATAPSREKSLLVSFSNPDFERKQFLERSTGSFRGQDIFKDCRKL